MSYITEAQARERFCPSAVHANYAAAGAGRCFASDCMVWRWFGHPTDDAWQEAVKKAAQEIGDSTSNRKLAAAHVNANRERYGLSTEPLGYCGLAGAPK